MNSFMDNYMRGQTLYRADQANRRREEDFALQREYRQEDRQYQQEQRQRETVKRQQAVSNRNALADFYTEIMGPRYGAAIGAGMKPSGANALYEMMNPPAADPFVPSKPYAGTDAQGNPVWLQQGEFGGVKLAPGGFGPPKKKGSRITVGEDGQITIEEGYGLTKSNKTRVQKSYMKATEDLTRIQGLKGKFKKEYLTLGGRVETNIAEGMDYLGMSSGSQQKRITATTNFFGDIKQFFMKFRKEITGAAAAVQELKDLEAAYLDGSVGPTKLMAQLDLLLENASKELKLNKRFIDQGIQTGGANTGNEVDYSSDPEYQQYLRDKAAMGGSSAPWSQ